MRRDTRGKRVATTHCFPWITDPNHPGWGPTCTADQRKDYAYIHSYFGKNSITLSHDGSTLIVVAAQKSRADGFGRWVSFNGYASGTTTALLVQDPTWQDADPPRA